MSLTSPQIGFDRFIKLEWATTALRIRAGKATLDDLEMLLDTSHAGIAAKKKTKTVLNRLWLDPRAELLGFADRGVEIYRDTPGLSASVLTWGMALATYPFFGKVAEIVGRLTTIQGDCTSAEVHRRMAEVYGEREGTRRMTNMILQSQSDWGAITRTNNGQRIARNERLNLHGAPVAVWLIEACLRYSGRSLSLASIQSHPVAYPFDLGVHSSYPLSEAQALELSVDGTGNQVVALSYSVNGGAAVG